jgi:hypothetical protein
MTRISCIRSCFALTIAVLSFAATAAPALAPAYTVETDATKAVVRFSYDSAERVLTARIERNGQPDHVYAQSLAQLKLDVSIGADHVLTVQGHTPTASGYIASADLNIGEETMPSQMWHTAASRQLRTTLGADIDVLRALPNREIMNLFIGPYIMATGDIGRVLAGPRVDDRVTPLVTERGERFKASAEVYNRDIITECTYYAACYWGCVAGGGGWIDCGPYCHYQQGC